MLCRSRAWPAGCIRTRCCHRNTSQLDQAVCHRVTRHTDCHRIQPAGRSVRHNVTFRKYHGQRSRPECLRQLSSRLRNVCHKRLQLFQTGNMRNQRVVGRATLGCVNLLCRSLIQCIRTKTINRLGRKCHQPAVTQNLRRLSQFLIFDLFCIFYFYQFCIHSFTFFAILHAT